MFFLVHTSFQTHLSIFDSSMFSLNRGSEFEAQASVPDEKRQRVSFNAVVQKVEAEYGGCLIEFGWGRRKKKGKVPG